MYRVLGIFKDTWTQMLKEELKINEGMLERRLKHEVEKNGGMALKFTSPSMAGLPDRIVLIPGGKAIFVEMKAPGKKLRPLQQKRKSQLEAIGFTVYCLDSIQSIETFIREVF
jgi:hypothetical protein